MAYYSPAVVQILADCRPWLLFLFLGRGCIDFVVDNRAIPSNALVPVGPSGSQAGAVVQVLLLELFAAAQVLEEPFCTGDVALDQCPHRVVRTRVQVLGDAGHAARKSTGKG